MGRKNVNQFLRRSVMTKDLPDLLKQMTLEEKASLCSGHDLWHLKGIG